MTDIPAAGNVTKSDIITTFTDDVITVANDAIVFDLLDNPFTNAGYASYANPHLSTTLASPPVEGDLAADIDAEGAVDAIADVLRNYAYNASRIRDVLYQYNNFGSPVTWGQDISNMNDANRQASLLAAGTPPSGDVEGDSGGNLQSFIDDLSTAMVAARAVTVNLLACHSSCHVSCHGARGRR